MNNHVGTATYSPEDNKIRITPFARLDKDVYERLRAAGFIWAPKQGVFVAPMWTPGRADLAEELCGELGDEDTTLVERAGIGGTDCGWYTVWPTNLGRSSFRTARA